MNRPGAISSGRSRSEPGTAVEENCMSVSQKIKEAMERGSWIRRMFEEGGEMKARLGADKVSDFTLGNPDLEPPPRFKEALVEAARDPNPGLHSYMTNA